VFAEEQNRPDVQRRRASWARHVLGQVDPARFVFIDETWVKTNMVRTHGWGCRGVPLNAHAPHGHWRTMTFLAALRHDRITAPFVFDGAINGQIFETYVEKVLLATLKPGDVVVLDNLGSHKGARVRRLIRDVGARIWFLPPYSPDLNPIEQVFSKIKRLLRRANERTFNRIWRRLGKLIRKIPADECARYIRNSGYVFST
jgi:transposase